MKRRELLTMATMSSWLGACAGTGVGAAGADVRGIGMVVEYELAPHATVKRGVNCSADTGHRLFGPAELNMKNGGNFQFGGATIPRWVRVTWREGTDEARGLYWTTGQVIGDYTVPVLERIPPQTFELIRAASGRALRLRFRIKDDGVLFGWAVQQSGPTTYWDIRRGGDFVDSKLYRLIEQ